MKNTRTRDLSSAPTRLHELPFERAITPHLAAMHAVAKGMLRSDDLAWDAVQETLLRAWGYGELPENPRGVLLGLVRKSCLHSLRCARRRRDHEALAHDGSSSVSCCAQDPAERISGKDELRVALSAMARLTKDHRESLRLVGHQGLSYDQAAARLGVPVGTVRSRTSRARAELKRLLTPTPRLTAPC